MVVKTSSKNSSPKKEEKNYITPDGLKVLQDEYNFLKKIERPKVCDIVSWAASLGDRSENADYQYGKKRLREIDKRMRFLGSRIDKAIVINPLEQSSEKIQFGATVTLEDEGGTKPNSDIRTNIQFDYQGNDWSSYFSHSWN